MQKEYVLLCILFIIFTVGRCVLDVSIIISWSLMESGGCYDTDGIGCQERKCDEI